MDKYLDSQVYPIGMLESKQLFIIQNKEELIKQLKSLKEEAMLNMRTFKDPVFYRDFNALKIVIEMLKKEIR